jgi:hypothetical protein
MVRLILLAGAWMLMRRYIFRRRTRIERDTLVARMTQKLRALAHATVRKPLVPAAVHIPALSPGAPQRIPSRPSRTSGSRPSSAAFYSTCHSRSL